MDSESSSNAPSWSISSEELFTRLQGSPQGLSSASAQELLAEYGRNQLQSREKATPLIQFLNQFKSPLVLILMFAAVISLLTGELIDASIILFIVAASAVLGFVQEYNAGNAVEKLRSRVQLKVEVLRDNNQQTIPAEEVVPGDMVLLSAGCIIPGDGVVFQADDFFVNQSVLTGETIPVEKKMGAVPANAALADRINCIFMGTNVRSGSARIVIFETGKRTAFGEIAEKLTLRPPETEFERGIRVFGGMLTHVMTILVLVVFAVNVILHKPPVDSLLFSVALAVGLSPPNCCPPSSASRSHKERRTWPSTASSSASFRRSELRKHGCPVHRQDQHPDLGRGRSRRHARCTRQPLRSGAPLRLFERAFPDRFVQSAGRRHSAARRSGYRALCEDGGNSLRLRP